MIRLFLNTALIFFSQILLSFNGSEWTHIIREEPIIIEETLKLVPGTIYLETGETIKFNNIIYFEHDCKNELNLPIELDPSKELEVNYRGVNKVGDGNGISIEGNAISIIAIGFPDLIEFEVIDFKVNGSALIESKASIKASGLFTKIEVEFKKLGYIEISVEEGANRKIYFAENDKINIRKIVFKNTN